MKKTILLATVLGTASFFATAQSTNRTYAITGKSTNKFLWADIKQIDLSSGKVIKTVFEADKTTFKLNGADVSSAERQANPNPTGLGVAACALDVANNRLYFVPMHYSTIYYVDLNQPIVNFTAIKSNVIALTNGRTSQAEENQITRMVIGADGYGYALNNDGSHLIRFTTGRKVVVEDLGNLVDAKSNQGLSIHNKCTSWGGDMLADAFGKLVVISANHTVFSIDTKSRVATYTGSITGLPVNFTTNGAAVDEAGNMVVASANVLEALYKVDLKTLAATKVVSDGAPFNAADLANGNLLSQKQADAANSLLVSKPAPVAQGDARVFPNPVTGATFKVLLDGQKAGKYTLLITDLAGRTIQSSVINLSTASQIESIRFRQQQAKGTYLVKLVNDKKQTAFTEKVVVQ